MRNIQIFSHLISFSADWNDPNPSSLCFQQTLSLEYKWDILKQGGWTFNFKLQFDEKSYSSHSQTQSSASSQLKTTKYSAPCYCPSYVPVDASELLGEGEVVWCAHRRIHLSFIIPLPAGEKLNILLH